MPVVPGGLINQIKDEQRRRAVQRMGLHSLIQVPMIANGRTVGVLALATTHPQRTYGPQDLELAQALAERAALALDNAARYEASQISERRYRSLIDATRQIVWTNTAEGMLVGKQPGWTQLTGQTETEYTGLGWTDRVNPEDLHRTFDAWQEALLSRTIYESHQRVTVASGEERHFNVRAVPVLDLDGQVREWVGVHTDITEQVRAETRLRSSEERFRSLVEASPIGIAVGAMDGSMHLANDAYLHMLGYSRAEFEAGQVNWAALTPAEFLEQDFQAFEQAFAQGTSEAYEKEMVCRDGRRIPVGLVLTRYEAQDETFVVAYVQNLTVQLEAERALREYGVELERRVEERTRALEQTNAELERFAYVASHDLQEPLRTIAGLTGLLEKRYADLYDERGQNLLRLIVEGTARMKTLLDDLLVFSRLGAELLTLEPVSATHLVEEARGRLGGLLEESGGQVTCGPLPIVLGNVFQLIQVFQNLIGNALKFRKPDSAPHVRISAEPDGEFYHFTVEDNGIGIDPAYFDRIFVMFQRLHGRDQYAGTGLGLAICHKVVERHGGQLWVESTPGEGSKFHFTLKAVQAGSED
ncbi:PAS domain S-box protein [Deinococcus malanensis]